MTAAVVVAAVVVIRDVVVVVVVVVVVDVEAVLEGSPLATSEHALSVTNNDKPIFVGINCF